MKTIATLLILIAACTTCLAQMPRIQGGRPGGFPCQSMPQCRPIICNPGWNTGWRTSPWGWNNWGWDGTQISVTYGNPQPWISSGFGTISVPSPGAPEIKIYKVDPPIPLTNAIIVPEGVSFRWRR